MSVASIQSLIQKYGANFGLKLPKTEAGAGSSGSASDSASGSTATSGSKQPDKDAAGALGILKTSAKLPNGDTVSLSPQAMDYLTAHTGARGKFEVPNMMDYFFDAADGTEAENASISNLAKMLGQHGKGSGTSDTSGDPFSSLGGFL